MALIALQPCEECMGVWCEEEFRSKSMLNVVRKANREENQNEM